ncbi:MAG TPA: DegV family protein, partial [Methylomirabilota bacterium]|nr:DegV family protein [Methylomirabilota bacterium]
KVLAGGRVRTMSRALDRLVTLIERRAGQERPLHMAVMHADAAVTATAFAERVRERFEPEEMLVTEFTSVMGAHTGPGFVGVAFFAGGPAPASAGSGDGDDAARLEASLAGLPEASASPALVIVSGLPGSGKSHFSRKLCQRYPLAHLNSDALRRALFAQPTHAAAESERLFAAVHVLLERLLSRGVSALLDATNLREAHRGPLYAIAERTGARLVIVKTEAPEEVALGRLGIRGGGTAAGDASDADAAVYDRMKGEAEPISRPHIAVDTSRDIDPALEAVLQRLNAAPRA